MKTAHRFVVITGLPASGKTTLARALARRLRWPAIDKDELLEDLFEAAGAIDLARRRELSRRADELLFVQAFEHPRALLSSWWRHPGSAAESGTSIDALSHQGVVWLELHCRCRPHLAAQRFMQRRRHAGHLDERWTELELLAMFESQARLGPLRPQQATDWLTELPFSEKALNRLARSIEAHLA